MKYLNMEIVAETAQRRAESCKKGVPVARIADVRGYGGDATAQRALASGMAKKPSA